MSTHTESRPAEPLAVRVERARTAASTPRPAADDRLRDLATYAAAGAAGAVAAALVSWWLVASISLPIPI